MLWLLTSIGVFYFTDFALVLLYDKRVDRLWLNIGASGIGIAVLCCLYCIVWLSWIKKVRSEKWEEYNPYVIPTATIATLIGGAMICKSVWPVWSILAIPILGTQFMGFIVFIAMIPDIL